MALFFKRTMQSRRTVAATELMAHARTVVGADDDTAVTAVSVSEHDCGEPGCCGARTIVLVMRPKRPTEAVKIDKPLEQVTQADLSDALAPLVARADPPAAAPEPK
jgi:hypothetical protein